MHASTAALAGTSWPARSQAADALSDACLQAHSAIQWLARIANSYRQPEEGALHLRMRWDAAEGSAITGEIAPGTEAEMRLPDFTLQFREAGRPTRHPIKLDDKSPAEVEAWTLIELLHRGIDRDRFSKDLPYDVSHLMAGDAQHFVTEEHEAAFEDLADWLSIADSLLREVAGPPARSSLRPEDFSLIVNTPSGGGEAGFCAGHLEIGAPFFFVAAGGCESERSAAADGGNVAVLGLQEIMKGQLGRSDVIAFLKGAARSPAAGGR